MFELRIDDSFREKGIPFGVLEVQYPDKSQWRIEDFEALKEQELAVLKETFADYDRKEVFGENPFNRYFKKYKKTYPVLQQLESILLKGREFPSGNPVNEAAFLTELRKQILAGSHDIDRIMGALELFCPNEKIPYPGMRGVEVHTYPGDCTCRDDGGIIAGMIAGADERTCLRPNSTHVAYLFFGAPGVTEDQIVDSQKLMENYVKVLAPAAETQIILAK